MTNGTAIRRGTVEGAGPRGCGDSILWEVLDGLPQQLCLLDEEGTVLAVNQAWRQVERGDAGDPWRVPEGVNYLEVLARARGGCAEAAAACAAGLRSVLRGEQPLFEMEYACHSGRRRRWYVVRAGSIPGRGRARVVVTHAEQTARRLAEEAVREEAKRSASLFHVARGLGQVASLGEVVAAIRSEAMTHLGAAAVQLVLRRWNQLGAVWVAGEDGVMRPLPEGVDLGRMPGPETGGGVVEVREGQPGWCLGLEAGGRCLVCALFRDRELIGYLCLGRRAGEGWDLPNHPGWLRGFADVAAMALARAQLLEELRRRGEELRMLAARTAEVSEAEHRRVAADLHDTAGQQFAALSFGMQLLLDRLPPEVREREAETVEGLRVALAALGGCIRGVMADLWPLLGGADFVHSVRGYVGGVAARTGLRVDVAGPEGVRLEVRVETALLRIVQEALANVVRHSGARCARITFATTSAGWRLEVADDGCGFEPALAGRSGGRVHLGLVAMRERALAVEAGLEVISEPGRGTRVVLEHPRRSGEAP